MKYGGNNFTDFPENQLTKLCAVYTVNANRYQNFSPPGCLRSFLGCHDKVKGLKVGYTYHTLLHMWVCFSIPSIPVGAAYVPFDRSHTSSYSSSVVTMAVSCTVCEIKRIMVEKRPFFIPLPFNLHDHLEPFKFLLQNYNTNCPSPRAIRWCKNVAKKCRVQQSKAK